MINVSNPYFSVVIPLYNKECHIKKTIESVLYQTFENFEIIVVNDGSQDDSIKIVESFQDYRITIINQRNKGVAVARNNGIKEAKSDYIAFLDADDLWLPNFLDTIHSMTINFPDAGMYATQYDKITNKGIHIPIKVKGLPTNDFVGYIDNYFRSILLSGAFISSSAVCVPKKIFKENNIWFPEGEKFGEDTHVWVRIPMLFEVVYNTKICGYYMIESENNTIKESSKVKELHNSILSLKNFRHLIKEKEKLKYFDLYFKKRIFHSIFLNIRNRDRS